VKPQGCGASVASAAGNVSIKRTSLCFNFLLNPLVTDKLLLTVSLDVWYRSVTVLASSLFVFPLFNSDIMK
jgi:hypothetical protein